MKKTWRNTRYTIRFVRGKDKGVYVDGEKINGNLVYSNKEECNVKVVY